jgi:predicted enzyme related to lactoylglutathione lyase
VFKVKAVRSWNLNADNYDETLTFYRDLLGGVAGPTRMTGEAPTSFVDVGGLVMGISDAAKGGRAGNPHHMFEIEWPGPLSDVTRELEAKGLKVEASRQVPDSRDFSLTLIDPAGNRVELSTNGRTAMSPR